MRCDEARRKLTDLQRSGSDPARDRQLQDHLRECPACAREAEAAEILRQDLADACVDDNVDNIPFAFLRERVETRATHVGQDSHSEKRILTVMTNQIRKIRRRPRMGIGIAVAVLLIVATLVPFKYDRTVGYEVAVAGVDKELATDTYKLQALLEKVGVGDASVNVADCDKTCTVTISDLDSPAEAEYVVQVFHEISGTLQVVTEANPIQITSKDNVFVIMHEKIMDGDSRECLEIMTEDSLQTIVVEFLNIGEGCDTVRWLTAHDEPVIQVGLTLCDDVLEITTEPAVKKDTDSLGKAEPYEELPEGYTLAQNHPNPFNPTTSISYTLPSSQHVTLEVYNIRGQIVRTLVDGVRGAGENSVEWDSTNDDGETVSSGVYLYRLTIGDLSETKKMILTK